MKTSRRALLAAVGTSALAGCSTVRDVTGPDFERVPDPEPGADSWPAPGWGRRNRRANPEASIPEREPSLEWSTPIAGVVSETVSGGTPSPLVSDGTVVLGTDEALAAVDSDDGRELWSVSMGDDSYVSPTVVGDTVYTGSRQGFHAFSLAEGSERWAVTAESWPMPGEDLSTARAPVVVDGRLFASTSNYALSLDDSGVLQWWADSPNSTPLARPVATDGASAFVAREFGETRAFDLPIDPWRGALDTDRRVPKGTGVRWERLDEAAGGPIVGDEVVYHPVYFGRENEHGSIVALDAGDGSERWSFETAGEGPSASLAHGTVFVGGSRGGLYALDAADGTEQWVEHVPTPEWEYTATEPKAGHNGVVATGEEIVHYGLDGTERWRLSTGARPPFSVTLTDGRLYVLTGPNEPESYLDYELRCYA